MTPSRYFGAGIALACTAVLSWASPQPSSDDDAARRRSHWAYQPVARPAVPDAAAEFPDRPSYGVIDRFVSAKLRTKGLEPASEADRRTLIRRVHFDLLGLPPTPQQVDDFVNDPAPNAYERMLEQVLAAPLFGERMAMIWLDLVRYGDTNGYHADVHRNVFPYRDYVIRAFNQNMPFDQFTIEQLAGDLLPTATVEQRVAAGYNRMNMITTEGGAQAKEYLAKYAADRVRNASTVWLASTLGCSECHDHKFDPFTTRDFYRFAAFFADVKQVGVYPNTVDLDPQLKVPTRLQVTEIARLDQRIALLQKTLDTTTPQLEAAQVEWERSLESARVIWKQLRPSALASASGTTFSVHSDGTIVAGGTSPDTDTYTLTFDSVLNRAHAIRIDVLPDNTLPGNGPGRASNGNFVLSRLSLESVSPGSDAQAIPLRNATASYEQKGGSLAVAGAIDKAKRDGKTGWAVADQFGRPHHAVFETTDEIAAVEGRSFHLILAQTHGDKHTLGRFRVAMTESEPPVTASATKFRSVPDSVADLVMLPVGERSDEQRKQIAAHYRSVSPLLDAERTELNELKKSREALDRSIPVTLETVAVEPPVMRILPRGNWMDDSGEVVQAGVPHFLPQPDLLNHPASDASSCDTTSDDAAVRGTNEPRLTRLDLARWIAAPNNPLTARVLVNRLWKQLFGQGLVRTSDDFGLQGTPPTHPELLDWLAAEFMASGWDIKHTIREIALSSTYRQSSQASPESRRLDPYNQWLARQGRFRLDAELVRDNALAVSGLLTTKIGGRSVKPYQPDGYWDHCNTFQGKLVYDQDHGDELYRRTLYTYWKRTFLHPALLAFDAPSREECTAERPRSNTPLQALVLLNDPTYLEAARVLAERLLHEAGPTSESRISLAYRLVLDRPPRADELQLLNTMLAQHIDQYRAAPETAAALVRIGDWAVAKDIDLVELAAWTSVARVLLNLHETITRY